MAYTTINKSTAHFDTNLYQANGSGKTISGMDFQPDLIWTKNRDSGSYIPAIVDAVRGGTKKIFTNNTDAESTDANAVTAFNSDGYTFGSSGSFNNGTDNYVNWCWKANGAGSANTDGSINSTVSVNTTAGFSIVSYTGTGSAGTIGHGLGSTPKMIIVKCRSDADTWAGYHVDVGATKYMELDATAVAQTSTQPWNDTEPTSSVFTVGNWSATNGSSRTYIAYCFAEKVGYSKFGSYVGNANTNGTFIYTGFKPTFVLCKGAISGDGNAGQNWELYDNARQGFNVMGPFLQPNISNAESTGTRLDILSNGFKVRVNSDGLNDNNSTYIYMAFGQSIVGTNNIPATAR